MKRNIKLILLVIFLLSTGAKVPLIEAEPSVTPPSVTPTPTNLVCSLKVDYSTYLGGSDRDYGTDIIVDSAGCAYVVGQSQSADFPLLNHYSAYNSGLGDVFVSKLSSSGLEAIMVRQLI